MRRLVATVLVCMLALTGCASWDGTSSVNAELASELRTEAGQVDPRAAQGVKTVPSLDDVAPVATNPTPALPVSLVDAKGFDVEVTDVSRILALDLYGTYTKTLTGLGLNENIVGRTVSSTEPSLADRPVVTVGGHNLNAEAILELNPTLVIVDESVGPPEVIEQIRNAGITTVMMNPKRSLETIGDDIRLVASVVGLPEEGEKLAERSMREVEEALAVIDEIKPAEPLRMAFLYLRGTGGIFYIIGEDYGSTSLINALGGRDMAAEAGITDLKPASPEALAELNPEMFVLMTKGLESTGGMEGLLQRPGVVQTIAGQNQRAITMNDGDSLAFGPQTGELLLRAAKLLYGEGANTGSVDTKSGQRTNG
ncbi:MULTISPECIES: hemin ABC transporter substrate-binding protein [Corynebacterium]|uniref:ABC transporter substrate-binding protein n=2 Tax=Corynebacterium TaxID=1716 RepID=A0AAP6XLV6_9CORY|nr:MULTISPECIES: ABC transporter substrate-binding protein [Corynebacterium]MCZ9292805.1 ABC transporter substrate-binding protein [Corynebacterium lehmanniae]MDK6494322.1 ABC transporter substrate-binding protein [Corynebacterium coyleae]MDK8242820.1 ABC transporter substrate-binding protein [Corynebacterium coyleae]MDK8800283.1 ABC transporter substrate-binding protein [Corynebacterium coyleae]NJJ04990.1 ABC transporter substrate-binding protein [Corynebacterium coyleae]